MPIQNCRCSTHRFPDGVTTRSNSTGSPFPCSGLAVSDGLIVRAVLAGRGCAGSAAGMLSRAGGSHKLISSRSAAGTAENRSAGVIGTLSSSAAGVSPFAGGSLTRALPGGSPTGAAAAVVGCPPPAAAAPAVRASVPRYASKGQARYTRGGRAT